MKISKKLWNSIPGKVLLGLKFLIFSLLINFQTGYSQLRASFGYSRNSSCLPVIINFQDSSSGNPVGYYWNFGNGTTSSQKNPTAIFYQAGIYSVKLKITDGQGKSDSIIKNNLIKITNPPSPQFSSDKTSGCIPLDVKFQDLSTGAIRDWMWDFGDGNISNQKEPSHTYNFNNEFTVTLLVTDSFGCSKTNTKNQYIRNYPKPSVQFSGSNLTGCSVPHQVNFMDQSNSNSNGAVNYYWDFGDGTTSTIASPVKSFYSSGKYTIKLKVENSNGCIDSIVKSNFVDISSPGNSFKVSSVTGCAPQNIQFSTSSSGYPTGTTFQWYFGDGTGSTHPSPLKNYSTPGKYTVTLVTQKNQCKDSVTHSDYITILATPTVNLSTSDSLHCKTPATVSFTGQSNTNFQWSWNFGDSTFSTQQNPVKNYSNPGTYNVSLRVTGQNGCSSTQTKNDIIKIIPPKAKFVASETNGCDSISVNFTDNSTSLFPIISRRWNFGDGSPQSNSVNPSHKYLDTGTYLVSLSIENTEGCKDSVIFNAVRIGRKPKTDFTFVPGNYCNFENVNFNNLTNNNTPKATTFKWILVDTVTYEESPTHKFNLPPSNYDITLISYNNGCADTMTKSAMLTIAPPYVNFTHKPDSCSPNIITFNNLTQGGTSFLWNFGNGNFSANSGNPQQNYAPGVYQVRLAVYDNYSGCYNSLIKNITVEPEHIVEFSSDTTGCPEQSISFTNLTNKNATYSWNFGNGKTSTAKHPTIKYSDPGVYTVRLTARFPGGCQKTLIKPNHVTIKGIIVNSTITPERGCLPLAITLTDNTVKNGSILTRHWISGTGDTIALTSDTLNYTYNTTPFNQGTGFASRLIYMDTNQCYTHQKISVYPHQPPADFTAKESQCSNTEFGFNIRTDHFTVYSTFSPHWDFGNGDSTTQAEPLINFANEGTYRVKLTLTDTMGCTGTITKDVVVGPKKLKANFTANPKSGNCPPAKISFTDLSQYNNSPITEWNWDFGDSSFAKIRNPNKIYLIAGSFDAKLIITDSMGCTDTAFFRNYIMINGPQANTKISGNYGCQPLPVNFSGKFVNTSKIYWDPGDGNIHESDSFTYNFSGAGTYYPQLFISDSNGCTYELPKKDTIIVNENPVSDFFSERLCFEDTTNFINLSKTNGDSITHCLWDFGEGSSDSNWNSKHRFRKRGIQNVTLKLGNTKGCTNSITRQINISGPAVDFSSFQRNSCLGKTISFTDLTINDTFPVSWDWDFGSGIHAYDKNPSVQFPKKGIYPVTLTVADAKGCKGTLTKPDFIGIGDTVPPVPAEIYSVSQIHEKEIRIIHSMSANPDFYKYVLYRQDQSGTFVKIKETQNQNDTVFSDFFQTNQNNSICYKLHEINFCGLESISAEEHCTIDLNVNSGINHIQLEWSPYKGWPVVSHYNIYRENPQSRGDFHLIDSVPGNTLAYRDLPPGCTNNNYYRVEAVNGTNRIWLSQSDTGGNIFIYHPFRQQPRLVTATVESSGNTKIIWEAPIDSFKQLKIYVIERSSDGINFTKIKTIPALDRTEFTDKDVNTSTYSYTYRIYFEDHCGGLSPYSNLAKTILLKATNNPNDYPALIWTPYIDWKEGIKHYSIEIKNKDATYTPVGKTEINTTFQDLVSGLSQQEDYCYRVIAYRNSGHIGDVISISNTSCAPVKPKVWIPSAFTPNNDGLNDEFEVKALFIKEFNLKIFNTWGQMIFEGNSIHDKWDGNYQGLPVPDGSYALIIYYVGSDRVSRAVHKNITLIR